MSRAAILCPGRGSYTERTLRSLPAEHPWIDRAEGLRDRYDLPSLRELDTAARFEPKLHLRPANASPLIWLVTMLDAALAAQEHEVVAIAGNSMGWYTALAVSSALDFDAGFRLVQEMALLQEEDPAGGQILYPTVGDDWRTDPERALAIERALASSDGEAFPSIHLGGYEVLAGTEAGIAHLSRSLPRVQLGAATYPLRLMQHGPYHTPLAEPVAARARESLSELPFRPPSMTLIDGRGARSTPWSTDRAALRDYTLGPQIVAPFDFTLSVRVLLREHAPDLLVLPGPGNTLGGVCGQILVAEDWRGIRSRADFEGAQASAEPVVLSMRR